MMKKDKKWNGRESKIRNVIIFIITFAIVGKINWAAYFFYIVNRLLPLIPL